MNMKEWDFPNKLYKWTFYTILIVIGITFFMLITGDSELQQNGFGIVLMEFFCAMVMMFVLSIITAIIYKEWFKQYWWENVLVFIFSGGILALLVISLMNGGIG